MNEHEPNPDNKIVDAIDDIGIEHEEEFQAAEETDISQQSKFLKVLEDSAVNAVESDDFVIIDPRTGRPLLFSVQKKNLFLTFSQEYIKKNYRHVLDNLNDLGYNEVFISKIAQNKKVLEDTIQRNQKAWILKDTSLVPKRDRNIENNN